MEGEGVPAAFGIEGLRGGAGSGGAADAAGQGARRPAAQYEYKAPPDLGGSTLQPNLPALRAPAIPPLPTQPCCTLSAHCTQHIARVQDAERPRIGG